MRRFLCILGLMSAASFPNAVDAQSMSQTGSPGSQSANSGCAASNSANTTKGVVAGAIVGGVVGNVANKHNKGGNTVLGALLGAGTGAVIASSSNPPCQTNQVAQTNPVYLSNQGAPPGPSIDSAGLPFIAARDYTITLLGCSRQGADVDCEFKLVNTADVDHDFMIVGMGSCCVIAEYVKTETSVIDMSGGYHRATAIQVADKSATSYESTFRIIPGIEYKIKLHFPQIGYHATNLARLSLGSGEHYDGDGFHKGYELPFTFNNVPISSN